MTAHLDIAAVTDDVLARAYDPGSLGRGRTYASERRARVVSLDAGRLTAVVAGSGRATYLVQVEWAEYDGAVEIIVDECSCPLGGACKHAVAALLTARGAARGGGRGRRAGRTDAPWRRALAGLVDDDGDTDDERLAPMALEVVVEPPAPSTFAARPAPRPTARPLRLGRNGRWVRTNASWQDVSNPAYTLRDNDPEQIAALRAMVANARAASYYPDSRPIPLEAFGPDLWYHLDRALAAGVALVGPGGRSGAVVVDRSATAAIDLTAADDGSVTMTVALDVDGERLTVEPATVTTLGSPAHGLVHERDGVVHLVPFAAPLHPSVATLMAAPPVTVPPHDVDELLDTYQPRLARHVPVASSDGSVTITTTELDGLTMTIERPAVDQAVVRWSARYRRGQRVHHHALGSVGGATRDRAAERALVETLKLPTHLLPRLVDVAGVPRDLTVTGPDAVTLLAEVVPWLGEQGQVEVEVTGDAPRLREATEAPRVALKVADTDTGPGGPGGRRGDRTDWFDLEVEVTVDGELVPFAALFRALTDDEPVLVLPTGTWLRLDLPELDRLKELIDEARGLAEPTDDATVRVNRFQVDWWAELTSLGVVAQQSQRWAKAMDQMGSITAPEVVEPSPGLAATLRPYQREGLDWLAFLHRHGLGGILADDMGLGKTVQALALCLHVLDRDPDARFLVVAPTSVVENWHREAQQFAPGVEVATIRGTAARRGTDLAGAVGDARLVVTSYALFRIEFEAYAALRWDVLFLDEAQFVKNHQGKTYQCVRRLDAATKVAVTGTPLENSLMDLWSLLSISAPGLYPDPKRFSDTYRKPIESGEAPELLATLRRRIAPLMRRRTKDEVLTELPPKVEQTVEVELSAKHRRVYDTQLQRQRQKVLGLVGDVQQHRFEILKSLTLLRQLSLDPGLVDPEHDAVGSAKLDRLVDDVTQVVAEGHRALVFSQFTRFLARARERLDRVGVEHAYLDGRTRRRDEAIASFRSGQVPVFVISLKAGGFGLNLVEADYCFVLDPWWNPAVETQAVDRAHRIGQVNPVMVYRYVAVDTIEEKVMELKARKAALFDNVVDADGALSGALTEGDIRGLLDLS